MILGYDRSIFVTEFIFYRHDDMNAFWFPYGRTCIAIKTPSIDLIQFGGPIEGVSQFNCWQLTSKGKRTLEDLTAPR